MALRNRCLLVFRHLLRKGQTWALFPHRWEGVDAEQSFNGSCCSLTWQQSGTWHTVGVLLWGRRTWRFNQRPRTMCPFLLPFGWVRNESLPALSRLPVGTFRMHCNNRIHIFFFKSGSVSLLYFSHYHVSPLYSLLSAPQSPHLSMPAHESVRIFLCW